MFQGLVQDQKISGNQDLPEGGFDGFLQSILCTNVSVINTTRHVMMFIIQLIGWRDVSRKLLLYITDAGYHFAGDGKVNIINYAYYWPTVSMQALRARRSLKSLATFSIIVTIVFLQLGGLILPHTSTCMMPNDGPHTGDEPVEFMNAETLDYPSVGQIAQALRDQDIIPIFAAERNALDFYEVPTYMIMFITKNYNHTQHHATGLGSRNW